MSRYTPNFNLFCVDPVIDGSDTFNITTMLNNNWDALDTAVAARAKLDGSTPFTGNVHFHNGIQLSSSGHRLVEFFLGGAREGYVGRVLDSNPGLSWIGFLNIKSGKSLHLYDNGSFKYGNDTIFHSGNHHTYSPVNKGGDIMTGNLTIEGGNCNLTSSTTAGDPSKLVFGKPVASSYLDVGVIEFFNSYSLANCVIAKIAGQRDGAAYKDGRLVFYTADGEGALKERMAIDSKGQTSLNGDLKLTNSKRLLLQRASSSEQFTGIRALIETGLYAGGYYNFLYDYVNGRWAVGDEGGNIKPLLHEGNHHTYTPVNKAGDTMTGILTAPQFKIKNVNDSFVYFQDTNEINKGYLARTGDDITLKNMVSGKALTLKASGQLLFDSNEIYHSANHHTYAPLASDGSVPMTGDLLLKNGIANVGVRFSKNGRTQSSLIYWNASDALDYGLYFNVDGNTAMSLQSNGGLSIYQGSTPGTHGTERKVFHEGNHHTFLPVNRAGDTMTGALKLSSSLYIGEANSNFTNSDSGYLYLDTNKNLNIATQSNGGDSVTIQPKGVSVVRFYSDKRTEFEGNVWSNNLVYSKAPTGTSVSWVRGFAVANPSGVGVFNFGVHGTGDSLNFGYIGASSTDPTIKINSNKSVDFMGMVSFKANSATQHTYLSFFVDVNNLSKRCGYFGYGSSNTTKLTLHNEIGDIEVIPLAGESVKLKVSEGASSQLTPLTLIGSYSDITPDSSVGIDFYHFDSTTPMGSVPRARIAVKQGGSVDGGSFSEESGELAFYVAKSDYVNAGSAILKERMRLSQNGYLGINTPNPGALLHIKPDNVTGIQNGIILEDYGSGVGEGLRIAWRVNDHAGVDLAAIDGGSSTTGGILKLLVNSTDTGAPTEKVRIEPSTVSIKADLDVTGKITNNGKTYIAGTYYQSSTTVSAPAHNTTKVNLNIGGDKALILVNAKSSVSTLNVVLNGYRPDEFIEVNPQIGIESGTTVYCSLERDTSSNLWQIAFCNTSIYNVNMSWKVLELA